MNSPSRDRFEIPIGLPSTNVLAIDKFIHQIAISSEREKLLASVPNTPEGARQFELTHHLPPGAFDFLLLSNDKEVLDRTKLIGAKYASICEQDGQDSAITRIADDVAELDALMKQKHPAAIAFLVQYRERYQRLTGGISLPGGGKILEVQDIAAVANVTVAVNAVVIANAGAVANAFLYTNVAAVANVNLMANANISTNVNAGPSDASPTSSAAVYGE